MLFLQWYVMFWEAWLDIRRMKVIWMLTSSVSAPSVPYWNCRVGRGERCFTVTDL